MKNIIIPQTQDSNLRQCLILLNQEIEELKGLKDRIEEKLDKSGGTVTGSITADITEFTLKRAANKGRVFVCGGNGYSGGASLILNGSESTAAGGAGGFRLVANDGTNLKQFIGYANGQLWWNGSRLA